MYFLSNPYAAAKDSPSESSSTEVIGRDEGPAMLSPLLLGPSLSHMLPIGSMREGTGEDEASFFNAFTERPDDSDTIALLFSAMLTGSG